MKTRKLNQKKELEMDNFLTIIKFDFHSKAFCTKNYKIFPNCFQNIYEPISKLNVNYFEGLMILQKSDISGLQGI